MIRDRRFRGNGIPVPGTVASFNVDLKRGQIGEYAVAAALGTIRGGIHKDAGDLATVGCFGPVDIECKKDDRFADTGNLAVELMDVHPTWTVGTGVAKSVHLRLPSLYVQVLGPDDYLVYRPEDMVEHIARNGRDAFAFLRAVQNRDGYVTINGLAKPERFPFARRTTHAGLRSVVWNWPPAAPGRWGPEELTRMLRTIVEGYPTKNGPLHVVEPFSVKGSPRDHDAARASMSAAVDAAELLMAVRVRELLV